MTKRLELLSEKLQAHYDNGDPGHDFVHIGRVVASARRIGERLGADLEILLPAALAHDIVNVPKNHPDRALASRQAAERAKSLLREVGYTESEIERIAIVIEEHSYSLGKKPSCLESAILQDADRLDALGAIGLMRTVSCGVLLKASYYPPEDPFAEKRELDDKRFTLDHLYVKLFKLPALMNTEPARSEAESRVRFMKEFVTELKGEIAGELR